MLQDELSADEYLTLMKNELKDVAGHWLRALINIEANKARIARWYDKIVKVKDFSQGLMKILKNLPIRGQKMV